MVILPNQLLQALPTQVQSLYHSDEWLVISEEYGLAMLKAGTNLASKSAEELIDIDAKTFELNGNQVRVAQVNTVEHFFSQSSFETLILKSKGIEP